MNAAWPKLLVVVACTLADSDGQDRSSGSVFIPHVDYTVDMLMGRLGPTLGFASSPGPAPPPSHAANTGVNASRGGLGNLSSVCSAPCSTLGARLRPQHLITPCIIALSAWSASALPTLVLSSRHKVRGIRSCLWQLVLLWLGLVIGSGLSMRDKVWGYAWMLHSSAQALAAWSPPKRVLVFQWAQPSLCALGTLTVFLFALSSGAPASLIRWHTGAQSQCGWSAHLAAVLGVDIVAWLLRPAEALVLGPQHDWEQSPSEAGGEDVLHLD